MSDKEQEENKEASKAKRALETSTEGTEEEEKRSTRKKARVDYSEAKAKDSNKDVEEVEDDDDEIQDVTPASIKTKGDEAAEPQRPPRSASDDLMGLPMEPTGLEGAGKTFNRLNDLFYLKSYMKILFHSLPKSCTQR